MGSVSKTTVTKLLTDRQPMCNNDLLRLLADQRGRSVSEMATHFHVTQTAIRKRLLRLTLVQSVTRQRDDANRRGRPPDLYFITSQGTARLAAQTMKELLDAIHGRGWSVAIPVTHARPSLWPAPNYCGIPSPPAPLPPAQA